MKILPAEWISGKWRYSFVRLTSEATAIYSAAELVKGVWESRGQLDLLLSCPKTSAERLFFNETRPKTKNQTGKQR